MRAIASFLTVGRISAFNYAYVLMMLPHGIFAMSLATVTFPTMAAQFAENNLEGLRRTLARATRVLIFLTVPSSVGLFLLRQEIVATLFEFGAFKRTSTELVASTLAYFALGLVAYAVVEILTRAFYALHDTATGGSCSGDGADKPRRQHRSYSRPRLEPGRASAQPGSHHYS